MSIKLFSIMFIASAVAMAQGIELGGIAGGGAFGVSSDSTVGIGQAGLQACVFCSGRFGLFGEYTHWFSANGGSNIYATDRIASADLAGGGLRIQPIRLARVFFDVGVVGGEDRHVNRRGGALGGVVVGTGIRIPWGQHWYLRPQFRIYGLSPHTLEGLDAHWAAAGSLAIGWRF